MILNCLLVPLEHQILFGLSERITITGLVNPDIAEFVNSCGGLRIRVEQREELEVAIRRALKHTPDPPR